MLISMNWIQDFVDLSGLDLDQLIQRFTLSTAEVEEVFHKGRDIEKVVAGKILSVDKHPNSKSCICSKWIRAAAWWTVSVARQTSGRECWSPLPARVAVYAPAKLGKRR